MDDETLCALWFSLVCGAANRGAVGLRDRVSSYRELYERRGELCDRWPELRRMRARLKNTGLEDAEKIAKWCESKKVGIYYYGGEFWPECLKQIPVAPLLLYTVGKREIFERLGEKITVTVVGTRTMSGHGAKATYDFAFGLAASGMTVVSGMADGVDSRAHRAALDADGETIAVWGCGIDRVYPAFNRELATEIAHRGLIITEYAPGELPDKRHFPERNRIMAALGMAALVVESRPRSGSLITADIAAEQGKTVFALMTDYDRRGAEEMRSLITDGACAVSDIGDIWSEYEHEFGVKPDTEKLAEARRRMSEMRAAEPAAETPKKHPAKREEKAAEPEKPEKAEYVLPAGVTGEARSVYEALSPQTATHVDELAEKLGLPIMKISAALTMLEMEGAVTCLPGRHYIRNGK